MDQTRELFWVWLQNTVGLHQPARFWFWTFPSCVSFPCCASRCCCWCTRVHTDAGPPPTVPTSVTSPRVLRSRPTVFLETLWTDATAARCARPGRVSAAAAQTRRSARRVWSVWWAAACRSRPRWDRGARRACACAAVRNLCAAATAWRTGTSASWKAQATKRRSCSCCSQ